MIAEVPPPAELGLETSPAMRVSVFMDVFDCHVNRVISGRVKRLVYVPGKFLTPP